jgi:hypothetical protein
LLEAAAVGISAPIGKRRQELMQQVTMGSVDFDGLEAGRQRSPRRCDEGRRHGGNFVRRHFMGNGITLAESDGRRRDRHPAALFRTQGALRLPAQPDAGLAAGMRQLDGRHAAVLGGKTGDPGQRGDLFVFPQTEIARADSPGRRHRRRLDDQQTGAAHRPTAVMNEVPVGSHAVPCRILAHRRNADTVAEHDVAEAKRFEQMIHGFLFPAGVPAALALIRRAPGAP